MVLGGGEGGIEFEGAINIQKCLFTQKFKGELYKTPTPPPTKKKQTKKLNNEDSSRSKCKQKY